MYHVQIVEDDDVTRAGISRLLDWNAFGFDVSCLAQNGKEALGQLEIEKVDLIITDIEMPVMDGLTFIRGVREAESKGNPGREIIVLTAYDDFDYAKEALRYGVAEYVLKPVSSQKFSKILVDVKKKLDERKNIHF